MENQNTIKDLFARFLNEQCSREEIEQLLAYFRNNKQEGTLRQLILLEMEKEPLADEAPSEAVREVYQSIKEQIHSAKVRDLKPARLWFGRISRVAAVWAFLLLSAGGAFYYFAKYKQEVHSINLVSVFAEKDEQKKVTLHDGSVVWLNSGAVIQFPEQFPADSRNVTLTGEAYFQVKKDSKRPFTVLSGNITTRVLGTSFNIRAYPGDSTIAVSVLTGKVHVSAEGLQQTMDLLPQQQAVYSKTNQELALKEGVNATALISWKEGRIQFRNQTFEEVGQYLSRRYNVQITLDSRIKDCPVHADFNENETVDRVLEMLLISLDGKMVHQEGSTAYHLTGNGCS